MSIQIPSADRIVNKVSVPDPSDKTVMNADNVMLILDKIVNGEYVIKLPVWNTSSRPSPAETGMIGINTDMGAIEYYDGSSWQLLGV